MIQQSKIAGAFVIWRRVIAIHRGTGRRIVREEIVRLGWDLIKIVVALSVRMDSSKMLTGQWPASRGETVEMREARQLLKVPQQQMLSAATALTTEGV